MSDDAQSDQLRIMPAQPFAYPITPVDAAKASNDERLAWRLLVAAVVITVILAIWATSEKTVVSAILAITAGLLQLSSVLISNRSGRADKNLVRHIGRRVQRLGIRMTGATLLVEKVMNMVPPGHAAQAEIGRLSVELSVATETLVELLETWGDLHPEVIQTLRNDGVGNDGSD